MYTQIYHMKSYKTEKNYAIFIIIIILEKGQYFLIPFISILLQLLQLWDWPDWEHEKWRNGVQPYKKCWDQVDLRSDGGATASRKFSEEKVFQLVLKWVSVGSSVGL